MITFTISELKKFLSNSKSIRDNKSLPILSYVKLECKGVYATLTKTSLNSFLIQDIDADFKKDEILLIEEKSLYSAVNFSKGKELKITSDGKNVIMNDGYSKTTCAIQDYKHFPFTEKYSGDDKIELNTDVISSLSVAKNHTLTASEKAMRDWKCFVHLRKINGKFNVIGVNGSVSYFRSFDEKLYEISLDIETVGVISKYPVLEYSSTDKYDYFSCLGSTYGFIKAETLCPDFAPVLERFKTNDSFEINRKDLMLFCEKTESMNDSAVPPEVSISDSKKGVLLSFVGIAQDKGSSEDIEAENKTFKVEPIYFQPKNMITVLNSISSEKIKISKIFGNMIVSSDDKNYTGSVMELAKL